MPQKKKKKKEEQCLFHINCCIQSYANISLQIVCMYTVVCNNLMCIFSQNQILINKILDHYLKAYYKLSLDRNFVYLIAIRSTSQTNLNFNVNQENPNDIIRQKDNG